MKRKYLKKFQSASYQPLLITILCFVLLTSFLQGCAAPIRHPVPEKLTTSVRPLQLESIRTFIDSVESKHIDFFSSSLSPVLDKYSNSENVLTMLALSGGSDGGAFGAGFLNGWTDTGNRPLFDVVTGISTGALMAPFAFLGSSSDESLKAVYTGISADNIYLVRSLGEMISRRDAVANSKPLAQLLETYVDDKSIKKIGLEHKKGRRLFVGTTHIDSGRLVVWDMGAIALSDHPDAPGLFRDVLLASASIPIAFPPVYISIEAEGNQYDEMHVDGGLITQVFGIETLSHLLTKTNNSGNRVKARGYMIRNSELTTAWQQIPRKVIDIGSRTVDIMINSQSIGDIFRNYVIARHTGIEFFLTGIPADFKANHPESFDTGYMNALFDAGYEMGKSDNPWKTTPPVVGDIMTKE